MPSKYLNDLVGVQYDGYEEVEHHVYEETDKAIEVDAAEVPYVSGQIRLLADDRKRHEHVVTVHQ